jgi:hypothetical protein
MRPRRRHPGHFPRTGHEERISSERFDIALELSISAVIGVEYGQKSISCILRRVLVGFNLQRVLGIDNAAFPMYPSRKEVNPAGI